MKILELFESAEKITYDEMSGNDFYYSLLHEPQNEGVRSSIKYLSSGSHDIRSEIDFVALTPEKKVVGVAGIQFSPYDKDEMWIKMISVDADFRNKGIGERLADMVFKYAKNTESKVRGSRYSELGEKHLRKRLDALANKYDVPFKHGGDDTKF